MEEMEPMLSLDTPFLLVKPNLFCSTPAIFKALDLDSRSTADPQQLLKKLTDGAPPWVWVRAKVRVGVRAREAYLTLANP